MEPCDVRARSRDPAVRFRIVESPGYIRESSRGRTVQAIKIALEESTYECQDSTIPVDPGPIGSPWQKPLFNLTTRCGQNMHGALVRLRGWAFHRLSSTPRSWKILGGNLPWFAQSSPRSLLLRLMGARRSPCGEAPSSFHKGHRRRSHRVIGHYA